MEASRGAGVDGGSGRADLGCVEDVHGGEVGLGVFGRGGAAVAVGGCVDIFGCMGGGGVGRGGGLMGGGEGARGGWRAVCWVVGEMMDAWAWVWVWFGGCCRDEAAHGA